MVGLVLPIFAQSSSKRPNIVLIYADDLGIGLLGHEGQQIIQTPHLDRLAEEGMRFQRAYSNMLCAPARASLIMGLHDSHQESFDINAGNGYKEANQSNYKEIDRRITEKLKPIPDDQIFLGQVAQAMGYRTAQIGKLEWGFSATDFQMKRHGWDYYLGYLDHVRAHGFYPPFLFENGKMKAYPGNTHSNAAKSREPETEEAFAERWDRTGKEIYSPDIFLEAALSFIENNRDRPFFLYFPTQLPHGPVAIPAIHPDFVDDHRLTQIEKEYASMVKLLDDQVGILMQQLKDLGIEDNTLVIFTADNGHEIYYSQAGRTLKPYTNMETGVRFDDYEQKYYSELAGDVFNGNGSQAGMKRSNLEGGIHVPLIIRWPGSIKPNQVSSRLTANYDILATVADIVGFDQELDTDGISFYPELVQSDGEKSQKHEFLVYSSYTGPTLISSDGWKLRSYLQKEAFELYYLPDDPREEKNMALNYPKLLEELKAKLLKACDGDFENGWYDHK